MKCAVAIALLLCGASLYAPPVADRVQKVSIFGKEYVRFDQWARANSFQWKWISKTDAQVWNSTKRIQISADSKRISLNGITILLSEPVRSQNGAPLIANLDLTTTLQPILFPPKGRPRSTVKRICIDPGHGGRQPGFQQGRAQEKTYTLLLAQELAAQLRKAGYIVSFTRTSDVFVDLPVRTEMARRQGADLFVSLHFNSAGRSSSEARGAETYCMTPQRASSTNARGEGANTGPYPSNLNNARNMVLAYEIQKAIVHGAAMEDRGVKRARFEVLRGAQMPAVLVEGGFMSNPTEARKISSPTWRRQMAQAIADGIASYSRLVQP